MPLLVLLSAPYGTLYILSNTKTSSTTRYVHGKRVSKYVGSVGATERDCPDLRKVQGATKNEQKVNSTNSIARLSYKANDTPTES